jgi:hypothetical protein
MVMNRRSTIALLAAALAGGTLGTTSAPAAGRGAGAGGVPTLDVTRSCNDTTFPDCANQEQIARDMLVKQWPAFTGQEKSICAEEARQAGPPSYIAWLTCLQINQNIRKFDQADKTAAAGAKTSGYSGGTATAVHRSCRHGRHHRACATTD